MPAKKSPSATSAATKKPATKPATKPAGARTASGSGTGAGGTKASGTKAGATSAARPAKKAPAPAPGADVVVTDVVEAPASRAAATRPVVVALRPDASGPSGQQPGETADTTVTLPFTGWCVTVPTLPALPTLPDEITLPVVGWTVNATEREAIAYYAVLGGLVAIEVIEWPLAALFVAGHVLARHTHYKGLEGAIEALEEA